MALDKKTVGLSADAQLAVDTIMETGMFRDQMDVAKLGLALAIARRLPPTEMAGVPTKWNVGSFDQDGQVRNSVLALYSDYQTPYRIAESLMNQGVPMLLEYIDGSGDLDLEGLLDEATASVGDASPA